MPRRVRMPGADELFRPTAGGTALSAVGSAARAPRPSADRLRAVPDPIEDDAQESDSAAEGARAGHSRAPLPESPPQAARGASGRQRHDEKITVYVSPEELLGLEQARLTLRARHGLAVDRGRIVREAVDLILADFEANGEQSLLVRALRTR